MLSPSPVRPLYATACADWKQRVAIRAIWPAFAWLVSALLPPSQFRPSAPGWQVTGVDCIGKALRVAQHKAAAAGVSPAWVEGDVTRLPELGIKDGFELLFDFGCFHGLSARQRGAYVRGSSSVAATGATFLLLAFNPGKRGPMPSGVSSEE